MRLDRGPIRIALHFVREQDVDDVRRLRRLFGRYRLEAVLDRQVMIRAARALADDHIHTTIAEILCLRVSLAAVAQDGNRLAFEERKIGVVVVVDGGGHGRLKVVLNRTHVERGCRSQSQAPSIKSQTSTNDQIRMYQT